MQTRLVTTTVVLVVAIVLAMATYDEGDPERYGDVHEEIEHSNPTQEEFSLYAATKTKPNSSADIPYNPVVGETTDGDGGTQGTENGQAIDYKTRTTTVEAATGGKEKEKGKAEKGKSHWRDILILVGVLSAGILIVVLIGIVVAVWYCRRKKRREEEAKAETLKQLPPPRELTDEEIQQKSIGPSANWTWIKMSREHMDCRLLPPQVLPSAQSAKDRYEKELAKTNRSKARINPNGGHTVRTVTMQDAF